MSETQLAPAKLTVHLHITGVRDDGYHLIDAEMVSLDLADALEFSDGDGLEVVGDNSVPNDNTNLVTRAMQALNRTAHVTLNKRIPSGGGLGGGSSDAAAVFRWAGMVDVKLAARLGADVPFCLTGGRARVRGIGDQIEPLPFESRDYTLLLPPFGVNTAAVYKAFDDRDGSDRSDVNHLEAAAIVVEPRLAEWRDRFKEWTGRQPVLAGSGSTWFVPGHFDAPKGALNGARWINARTTEPIPLDEQ